MHKKRKIRIITILIINLITLLNLNIKVFANGSIPSTLDPLSNPGFYNPGTISEEKALISKAGEILGVINVVGVVISVITLMILGIKYMFGSIEEKAEYKKTMGLYILGAVLVFSITTIPNILFKIGTAINS